LADKIKENADFLNRYCSMAVCSTITAMFSCSLLFTESMPQQVKESQSMDQQYFKRKDTATAIGNYSAFKAFHHASSWQD
jgi:hypothetical protein